MPQRFELTFQTTRDDWIAVNEALLRISPAWAAAARQYRRSMLRQTLLTAPLVVGGASFMIGRSASTSGMYVEGALVGVVLVGIMAFGLPRLDTMDRAKRAQLQQARQADVSDYVGETTLKMDELGIGITTPSREIRLSWTAAAVHDVEANFLVSHGGAGVAVIPKRAFASLNDANAFGEYAVEWWRTGQLPAHERLTRYLADRDVACPTCRYNLRGVRGDRCPECGASLQVDDLLKTKQ